ncbi:MAG: hypothetical protein ACP5SH_15770, partial [Syntrophobacteraceae bacterium]
MKIRKIALVTIAVLTLAMFGSVAYCFLGGADPSRNMGNYRSFSFYADRPGNAAAGWMQPGAAPPSPWDEFWFDNSGSFNLSAGLNVPGQVGIGSAGQLRYSGGNLQYSNDGGSTFTNLGASLFPGWTSGGTGIFQGQAASSPSNPSNEFWFDNSGAFNLSGALDLSPGGITGTLANPYSTNPYGSHCQYVESLYNTWTSNLSQYSWGTNVGDLFAYDVYVTGGSNVFSEGYVNKNNYAQINLKSDKHTAGQDIPVAVAANNYSNGDTLPFSGYAYCYGGQLAGGDEGCHSYDFEIFQGNVDYVGTVTTGGNGATNIVVNPTQGSMTLGEGRYLINTTQGVSTGTIATISGTPPVVTFSGYTPPASTVNTTLPAGIGPADGNGNPPYTVTIQPTSGTGIAGITTATLLTIADANNIEHVYPSSVNTSAGTFTVTLSYPHNAGATVTAGGLAGYYMEIKADDVLKSTSGNPGNGAAVFTSGNLYDPTLQSSIKRIFPVISSTNSSVTLWMTLQATYKPHDYAGSSFFPASGNNGYVLYPGAIVTHLGTSTGYTATNIGLEPNNVAWNAGDTVEEPVNLQMLFNNYNITQKYAIQPARSAGVTYVLAGLWGGAQDVGMQIMNTTPDSAYQYVWEPLGIDLIGDYRIGLNVRVPPLVSWPASSSSGALAVAYNQAPAPGQYESIIAVSNTAHDDHLLYDPNNFDWLLTFNGWQGSFQYADGALSYTSSVTKDLTIANTSTGSPHIKTNVGLVPQLNAPAFSATPVFDGSKGNTQQITLTGNVTGSTLVNVEAGEQVNFLVCQDATGSRTFAWPANIHGGMTIGQTANKCSAQSFLVSA